MSNFYLLFNSVR